jgi:hypothetical protein
MPLKYFFDDEKYGRGTSVSLGRPEYLSVNG